MKITHIDKIRCEQLVKCMNKVTYSLEASEVPAVMQIFQWMGELQARIEADLIADKMAEKEAALRSILAAEQQAKEDLEALKKDVNKRTKK
jgi:hypothetical protein